MTYQGQPARPTVYRGIHMRSRLEARWAAYLDGNPSWRGWEYEPRAYADQSGQWLPDFVVAIDAAIEGREDHPWFFEVKPTREMARAAQSTIRRVFASEPEAWALAVWPHEHGSECPCRCGGSKWDNCSECGSEYCSVEWVGVAHDQHGFRKTVYL